MEAKRSGSRWQSMQRDICWPVYMHVLDKVLYKALQSVWLLLLGMCMHWPYSFAFSMQSKAQEMTQ